MLLTTSLMRGGAELQVYLLARGLKIRGHDVTVVSMRDPEALEQELADSGVPVVSLGMRSGVPDPRAVLRLAREIRRTKPQIVHSHMVHANLLGRITRIFQRAPVLISTAHNLTEGARWRELAYRLTDPLASLTTNVSPSAVERFVKVGAVRAERIRYVPNGLDLGPFYAEESERSATRAELGVNEAQFAWLAVGRLEEQKDYPNLLNAVARLLRGDQFRADDMVLLVVSDGPQRSELEELRRELELDPETIRFLGSRSDVPDLMRAADGYVMSSAWEGLPMVLLEAAAAGLPIVATNVGGNGDIVVDGRTGFLVPPRDPISLGGRMKHVMLMPSEQRSELGRAARGMVEDNFEIGSVVDMWLEIYNDLLGQGNLAAD